MTISGGVCKRTQQEILLDFTTTLLDV